MPCGLAICILIANAIISRAHKSKAAGPHTITAAHRLPHDLRQALDRIYGRSDAHG